MPSESGDLHKGHAGILSEFPELSAGAVTHGELLPSKNVLGRGCGSCVCLSLSHGSEKVPTAQILGSSHSSRWYVMGSSCQSFPRGVLPPPPPCCALGDLRRPSLQHPKHRLLSHWLCVRTCYSNQSICIYVDMGIVSYFAQETLVL